MFTDYHLHIRPNKLQVAAFEDILLDSCETYNAALQERRDAWKMCRESITYYHQQRELTELRNDPQFARIAVDIQREPLRRVDHAFQEFFRRCRAGQKPGFPRFKACARYDSFAIRCNVSIHDQHIKIPNLGYIRFTTTRDIRGKPKTATIKRCGKKWAIKLCCDIGPAPDKRQVSNPVGIDLGLTNFLTLSDGSSIANPRWTRKHETKIAVAHRRLALKQKRSKNRLKAREILRRACQRAADARRNFTHHVSKGLVSKYDLIAFEKLNIKGLVRSRSSMAKSVLDAAWAELIWQITYKAERAGKWAVPVNSKGTSVKCSQCGVNVRKTLADRQHICVCGAMLDRDHNAALNILALGMSAVGLKPSERAPVARIPELAARDYFTAATANAI